MKCIEEIIKLNLQCFNFPKGDTMIIRTIKIMSMVFSFLFSSIQLTVAGSDSWDFVGHAYE